MSNATWTAVVYALVAACASAGQSSPDAAGPSPHHPDAQSVASDAPNVKMDAPMVVPDAFVPHDAAVPVDSAIFCSANSQCTNSGECCIILGAPPGICGPGVLIGSTCIPQ